MLNYNPKNTTSRFITHTKSTTTNFKIPNKKNGGV
jgi:hypothetical protein